MDLVDNVWGVSLEVKCILKFLRRYRISNFCCSLIAKVNLLQKLYKSKWKCNCIHVLWPVVALMSSANDWKFKCIYVHCKLQEPINWETLNYIIINTDNILQKFFTITIVHRLCSTNPKSYWVKKRRHTLLLLKTRNRFRESITYLTTMWMTKPNK